jgi:3-oxoacyl-[acyl-carrier protein] reductase
MELDLKNKTAIVTGGSRGLGKAICEALAAEGVNIVLNYVSDEKRAVGAAGQIAREYGVRVLPVMANVASEADVAALFERTKKEFGEADILVNNAGICPVKMIADTSYDEWKQVMDINVGGIFLTSRAFMKGCIVAKKGGRVVNIVSQSAFNGSKRGKTHYATSKGAAVSFTISFAKEVSAYGINVNAVSPGLMVTDMTSEMLKAAGEMDKYKAAIPKGRPAQTAEVAQAVVYLCGSASGYITGSIMDVSGGMAGR